MKDDFEKSVEHLRQELAKLQTGRASAALVEEIDVDAYGGKMQIKSLANISCPDAKTVRVEPWDKVTLSAIEKGIQEADIGITPQNMGDSILLPIPPMTEERRKQLAKLVHELAEKARISVRNTRHEYLKDVKKRKDDKELSEDEAVREEKAIQQMTDEYNKKIDEVATKKEQEVLSV